jgi:hypothetical protein
MRERKEKPEDPVITLARCINLLDDIRAYRRKDVEKIEQTFSRLKGSRFKEFYDMWVKLRPHAEKIVDMPMQVNGVRQMINRLAWVKLIGRVGLIVIILLLSLQIVPAWRRALGGNPFGGQGIIYVGIVVVFVAALMNLSSVMDYRIRKRVIAYEDATVDKYAPNRERMKEGVNRMLRSLGRESTRKGRDPRDFGLVLYFDDYDNIQVVKKWQPKSMGMFKKSYYHYQVLPKP